ncbi:hypothetical protein FQZ97_1193980 [compost metagenome]
MPTAWTLPTAQLATWSWPKRKRVSNCVKLKHKQPKSSSKARNALLSLSRKPVNRPASKLTV